MDSSTKDNSSTGKVNIRPGVSVLSVLSRLNYRTWYAVAEFVDNAIQSSKINRDLLISGDGQKYKLKVDVVFETSGSGKIVIRDNAAGINDRDYARAFRAAELPPDRSGLSEFGMGMKSAACWFARKWHVKTKALNESVEKTISFDIARIVEDKIEELDVARKPAKPNSHFTEVTLCDLYNVPYGRTISKTKEHLASIYREFIRDGSLVLTFNGEPLNYEDPVVLNAPYYKDLYSPAILWRKEISFDFGMGMRVHGFAAIREIGSVSDSGFALFRRGRVIQGSADDGYRPEKIFGKSNSYSYQRLFGELHLEGMDVSHTKDGFKWDDTEDPFLDILREHLNSQPMPLLDQAEGHRSRQAKKDLQAVAIKGASNLAKVLGSNPTGIIGGAVPIQEAPIPKSLPEAKNLLKDKRIELSASGEKWIIEVEITNNAGDWLNIAWDQKEKAGDERRLKIRVDLASKFMERYVGVDQEKVDIMLLNAAAYAVAIAKVRESGAKYTGDLLKNINSALDEITQGII